jgi:hypothetical protein
MPKAWWQYVDEPCGPFGQGSINDVQDTQPEHRFWRLRSTSKAAAIAYSTPAKRQPIGFHIPETTMAKMPMKPAPKPMPKGKPSKKGGKGC